MLRAWRRIFEEIEAPGAITGHEEEDLGALLAAATLETRIAELRVGARVTNALDRANILTVKDLLLFPRTRLQSLRGVGFKTRKRILEILVFLGDRLGPLEEEAAPAATAVEEPEVSSLDLLVERVSRASPRARGDTEARVIASLLGLDALAENPWPSQTDIATRVGLTPGRISQIVTRLQKRWAGDRSLTRLRADLAEIPESRGGVMALDELAGAVLTARGSVRDEPLRSRLARAVVRAAVEVERSRVEARFSVQRTGCRVLIAAAPDLADYGRRLGTLADRLAQADPLVAPEHALEQLRSIPMPARPALDRRLEEVGLDLLWSADKDSYVSRSTEALLSSDSSRLERLRTMVDSGGPVEVTPEMADARHFEERLHHALDEGVFLALTVKDCWHSNAPEELDRRYQIDRIDFEALLLEHLEQAAREVGAQWDVVLRADTAPRESCDGQRLLRLVRRVLPEIERKIVQARQTVLLTYVGLLARYDSLDLLERLRDQAGRPGGPPGLWVLLPAQDETALPMIDGLAVPLLNPSQHEPVPRGWLENLHRGAGHPPAAPARPRDRTAS